MAAYGVFPWIALRIRVPPGQRKKESGVPLNDQHLWLCRVAPRERGVLRFDADAAPFFWRGPMKLCERL
jgi:hypothetical protein